jgi:hypothetical protein
MVSFVEKTRAELLVILKHTRETNSWQLVLTQALKGDIMSANANHLQQRSEVTCFEAQGWQWCTWAPAAAAPLVCS